MAITGSGTEASPYIVHDYTELKTVCECGNGYNGNEGYKKYVRLANDINCNDKAYPVTFEWETIKLGGGSGDGTTVNLDMYGHTIKNVMIKAGNSLFQGTSYDNKCSRIYNTSEIMSGRIQNIFSNNAQHIIDSDKSQGITCNIEGISMSVNGTTLTSYAFVNTSFNQSSLYYKTAKMQTNVIYTYTYECSHSNSDFYFDIADVDVNSSSFVIIYNNQSKSTADVDNCRIRGNVSKSKGEIYIKWENLSNCVLDITQKISSSYTFCTYCNTVIYNKDKATGTGPYTSNSSNIIAVTTDELKNADTLSSKGFVVVDIAT